MLSGFMCFEYRIPIEERKEDTGTRAEKEAQEALALTRVRWSKEIQMKRSRVRSTVRQRRWVNKLADAQSQALARVGSNP